MTEKIEKAEFQDVYFHTGECVKILKSIIERYKALQAPIIFRSYKKFDKYILPLLYCQSDSLMTEALDTQQECTELMNEIKYYKLEISQIQALQLAQNTNLIGDIEGIREYMLKRINPKTGLLKKKSSQEKVKVFSEFWNNLLLAVNINNYMETSLVKSLLFANLINLIMNSQMAELANINIQDSMLSLFCKYFKRFVCDHNKESLNELKLSFGFTLDIGGGIQSLLSNVIPNVTSVIGDIFGGGNAVSQFSTFAGQLAEKCLNPSAGNSAPSTVVASSQANRLL
jgi:hypothetical protein